MRTSRNKTAKMAVWSILGALLFGFGGVQAANAFTSEDPVTTDEVVTEAAPLAETAPEVPPAEEEPPVEELLEVTTTDETDETEEVTAFAPTAYKVTTEEVETEHIEVTICHADNNADQPYGPKAITVDDDAVDGVGGSDHYGKHTGPLASTTAVAQALKDSHVQWGDIIPPLPGVHDGLNWTAEGQAIWAADCAVPPPSPTCIQDPTWSYTFDPATGSGDVTVTGGEEGEELCAPLAIRAAAWTYDLPASGSPSWPQTLNGYNDTTVDKIGEFSYGPPQLDGCRQYDVYASFGGFDELELPEYLNGSHDPFEPAFLHETLSGFGPNPTWSFTSSEGCNPPPTEIEPDSPTKVDVCGIEDDSFTLPGAEPNELESVTSEGTYTADDLPTEDGIVAVTFVPADGFVVKDDPNAEYEVDENGNAVWILVFTDETCPVDPIAVKPAVQYVVICGVDNDTVTTPGTPVENAEGITETEEFYYVTNPNGTDTPGTITVLAIPKDGVTVAEPGEGDTYVIDGDGNASWTFVDDDAACPSTTTTGQLPLTGGDDPWWMLWLVLALLGIGIPAIVFGPALARKAKATTAA